MPEKEPQRDVLPIPDRPYEGTLSLDAKDPHATFRPIEPLRLRQARSTSCRPDR